ncbi:MAG: type II toxin-antitoxin system VapC family toxin [Planctomycetaceae bacterium]
MPSMPPDVVVVDAGPLLALFDIRDEHHRDALNYLHGNQARMITTLAVVTEAMHLFGPSPIPKRNLLAWINSGAITLVAPNKADFERVMELLDKYADLPMDFANGLTVAICERLDIPHIATFDSDFTVYRFKERRRFVNVMK